MACGMNGETVLVGKYYSDHLGDSKIHERLVGN